MIACSRPLHKMMIIVFHTPIIYSLLKFYCQKHIFSFFYVKTFGRDIAEYIDKNFITDCTATQFNCDDGIHRNCSFAYQTTYLNIIFVDLYFYITKRFTRYLFFP